MAEMMMNGGVPQQHTTYETKYVEKHANKENEHSSKSVGNTALGLSIGALALTLLNRNGIVGNILGTEPPTNHCEQRYNDRQQINQELFGIYKNNVDSSFSLYKGYRDADALMNEKYNQDLFALYKNQRDSFDILKGELDALKQKQAVAEAIQPWKDKTFYDALALEAERRCCADNKIVGYTNSNFYPINVADVTIGTTSTARIPFNPLCGCC